MRRGDDLRESPAAFARGPAARGPARCEARSEHCLAWAATTGYGLRMRLYLGRASRSIVLAGETGSVFATGRQVRTEGRPNAWLARGKIARGRGAASNGAVAAEKPSG